MEFFNTVSVEEARRLINKHFKDYEFKTENINILDSLSRIVAENIYSSIDVPEFDRSSVDGYGINVADSHGATDSIPSILDILGEIKMGQEASQAIRAGQTVYVPTGGMIPQGANGVIMIENTEKLDDRTLLLYKAIPEGAHIVRRGEDIEKDSLVIEGGRKISPEIMGVLAALGIGRVKVYKKPKFYIISTGDEIIDLDEELTIGKIRDINTYGLYGEIQKLGGQVVGKTIVKDDFDLLRMEVEKALAMADIVLISGGSSVGARDYSYKVIDSFEGQGVFVHGVSIKPGKPTIIGEARGKLIFGLPGHPVSTLLLFKTFVEDYVKSKLGTNEIKPRIKARMDFNFPSSPGKLTYQLVTLEEREGAFYASPSYGRSGLISLLAKSQGYIILEPYEEGIYKGEEREVYFF